MDLLILAISIWFFIFNLFRGIKKIVQTPEESYAFNIIGASVGLFLMIFASLS